jgi:ankyrin repeat protein
MENTKKTTWRDLKDGFAFNCKKSFSDTFFSYILLAALSKAISVHPAEPYLEISFFLISSGLFSYIWADSGIHAKQQYIKDLHLQIYGSTAREQIGELKKLLNDELTNLNNDYGHRCLKEALKAGNIEIANLLKAYNAPVNITSKDEEPALITLSQMHTTPEVKTSIQWLLNNGVNVNAQNAEFKTALHYAFKIGNIALIKALHTQGAILSIKDIHKKNPTSYATPQTLEEAKKFLKFKDS